MSHWQLSAFRFLHTNHIPHLLALELPRTEVDCTHKPPSPCPQRWLSLKDGQAVVACGTLVPVGLIARNTTPALEALLGGYSGHPNQHSPAGENKHLYAGGASK